MTLYLLANTVLLVCASVMSYSMSGPLDDSNKLCCSSFLSFLPDNTGLVSLVDYHRRNSYDTTQGTYAVRMLSTIDGHISRELPLPRNVGGVYAFNVSHDGLHFVLLSSPPFVKTPLVLRMYSLTDGQLIWERQWYGEAPCLRLAYIHDNARINCVSPDLTVILNSADGSLVQKSNAIASLDGMKGDNLEDDLSENGSYVAIWRSGILTNNGGADDMWFAPRDYVWYGLRWLFTLGSVHKYINVWDINADTLLCKFQVPYPAEGGTPAFTADEKEILVGPIEGKCRVYSLRDKNMNREFVPDSSVLPKAHPEPPGMFYKVVSPDKSSFAALVANSEVLLSSYENGHLLNRIKRAQICFPGNCYAMAFSSDGSHFAVLTVGNKLDFYDMKANKRLWEIDIHN